MDKMKELQQYNNLLMEKFNLLLEIEHLKKTNMRTQFFYTRREVVANGAPSRPNENPIYVNRKDSFNVNAVVRSVEMADGSVLVLLNDIHERTTETPNISVKSNKVTGMVRKRDTFQSEIYLSKEDGERFFRASAIDEPLTMDMNVLKKLTDNGIQETIGETSLSGDSRGTKE